jgi:hypothetical protein
MQVQHGQSNPKIKTMILYILFGWLGMPVIVGALFNSMLPVPIKNTVTAANAFYSDTVLGLQCKYREVGK